MLSPLILILLAALVAAFLLYHLAMLIYYGIKSGIDQANALESEFGTDVLAAAKYTILGGDNANNGTMGSNPVDKG